MKNNESNEDDDDDDVNETDGTNSSSKIHIIKSYVVTFIIMNLLSLISQ